MTTTERGMDMIHPTDVQEQDAIRRRLDEIWAAAGARDFDLLDSFHRYDAHFTSFKEGSPRADAVGTAAGEHGMFMALEDPQVDMRDLDIRILGIVGLVTFNGHFTARLQGDAIAQDQQVTMVFARADDDWKIIHEHFSPLASVEEPRQ